MKASVLSIALVIMIWGSVAHAAPRIGFSEGEAGTNPTVHLANADHGESWTSYILPGEQTPGWTQGYLTLTSAFLPSDYEQVVLLTKKPPVPDYWYNCFSDFLYLYADPPDQGAQHVYFYFSSEVAPNWQSTDKDDQSDLNYIGNFLVPAGSATWIARTGDWQDVTSALGLDPAALQVEMRSALDPVPEPATLLLVGVGVGGLVFRRWWEARRTATR